MNARYMNGATAPKHQAEADLPAARITVDLPLPLWEALDRVGQSIVANDVADHDSIGVLLRELRSWILTRTEAKAVDHGV